MRFDQLIAEELIVFDPSIDSKGSLFDLENNKTIFEEDA